MSKITHKSKHLFCFVRAVPFVLLVFVLLLGSCTRQLDTIPKEPLSADPVATRSSAPEDDSFEDAVPIVLGQDMKNPYDIAVMQQVLNALMGASRASTFGIGGDGGGNNPGDGDGGGDGGPAEDLDAPGDEGGYTTPPPTLRATHYYYRFLPATEEELDLLKERWELYSYPLTYEIASGGDYYHDPSLPESGFTWQYAVVPVTDPIPLTVRKELLSELFLNTNGQWDEMVRAAPRTRSSDYIPDFGAVEEMAYNMLNIEEDPTYGGRITGTGGTGGTTSNLFFPSGKIEMYDDLLNRNLPLAGVKVRIRNRFRTEVVFTLADGTFRSPKEFYGPVDYCIVWEHQRWDIRAGAAGQAYFMGPAKTTDPWNLLIKRPIPNSDSTLEEQIMNKASGYATVHRALMRYYYGDILGMVRPNNVRKLKIGYKHIAGTSVYIGNWSLGILSDIRVYGIRESNDSRTPKNVAEIFSDACHEIAHSVHFNNIGMANFVRTKIYLYESWAVAVEHFLTNDEYHNVYGMNEIYIPNRSYTESRWPYAKIDNIKEGNKPYSPLFIDLIDSRNQKNMNKLEYDVPNDEVSGYTIAQLNILLFNNPGITDLYYALLAGPKPAGVTNEKIELLFQKYFEVWDWYQYLN